MLDSLQSPPLADQSFPMGDLGSYPMHAISDATTFDHLVHLAIDLLAPTGPLTRPPIVLDDDRMVPTLDWMVAGIPQMCGAEIARSLTSPVEIRLEGPGARRFVLLPIPGEETPIEVQPATGTYDTVVTSSAIDFLSWGTTRSSWRPAVRITGDEAHAAEVLDRINVVRRPISRPSIGARARPPRVPAPSRVPRRAICLRNAPQSCGRAGRPTGYRG